MTAQLIGQKQRTLYRDLRDVVLIVDRTVQELTGTGTSKYQLSVLSGNASIIDSVEK